MTTPLNEEEKELLARKIEQLHLEHRDLDDIIVHLQEQALVDQLQLRRLKKRKLLLKDIIARLQSQLIPDLDA